MTWTLLPDSAFSFFYGSVATPTFKVEGSRSSMGAVSCAGTEAAESGIDQIPFDEFTCIPAYYFSGFQSGKQGFGRVVECRVHCSRLALPI